VSPVAKLKYSEDLGNRREPERTEGLIGTAERPHSQAPDQVRNGLLTKSTKVKLRLAARGTETDFARISTIAHSDHLGKLAACKPPPKAEGCR